MAENKVEAKPEAPKPEAHKPEARHEAKAEQKPQRGNGGKLRLQKIKAMRPKMVMVHPANDDVRRLIKHPKAHAFKAKGGALWPHDRFTQRRLADGDITIEKQTDKQEANVGHAARPAAATHT